MTRSGRLAAALIVLSVAPAIAGSTTSTAAPAVAAAADGAPAAVSSTTFGDAVGVNVHLGLPGTSYADFPRVESLLVGLGVRHVRTALPRAPTQAFYDEVTALASRGIHTDLILGSAGAPKGGGAALTPVAVELARIDDHGLAPALDAIEGPNEWDSRGGATWVEQVRNYQQLLYTSVKADPLLAGIPVIGPSVANIVHASELGDLSGSLDYGNVHAYPRGGQPLSRLSEDLAGERSVSGSKPVMATETGYQTAVNGSGIQPPVSPTTQAVYLSWLYPAFATSHVARTYVYELLDGTADPSLALEQAHFGIVTADGGVKPAYPAIQGMLALIGAAAPSSGRGVPPDPVHVSGGADGPSDLVVHRSDGAWVVLLWSVASVPSDLRSMRALPAATAPVQLQAPGYVATTYRPTLRAGPLRAFAAGATVSGTVGPDLAVVVFSRTAPAGTTVTPASGASSVDAFASPYQPAPPPAPGNSTSTSLVIGAVVLAAVVVVLATLVVLRRRRRMHTGAADR
jgi:trimeric autotransporter adhesin